MAATVLLVFALVPLALSASVRERMTTNCNRMCLDNYMPVCGSDGKTYGNQCVFDGAKCENPLLALMYHGPCGISPLIISKRTANPCGFTACIALYDPVCGSDGITYGNSCSLDLHNCDLGAMKGTVTVAHKGECHGHVHVG